MATVKIVKIENRTDWTLSEWHGVVGATKTWRVWDTGIYIQGDPELGAERPQRTRGEPITCRRIRKDYGDIIRKIVCHHNALGGGPVTLEMMTAVIATESGGHPEAERFEAHINDTSIGLCQLLTGTATELFLIGSPVPELNYKKPADLKTQAAGGDMTRWRELLRDPQLNIELCARYLDKSNKLFNCQNDPALVYASFNAGSVRLGNTPWGFHYYLPPTTTVGSVDWFVKWYGDACAVWREA